MKAKIESVETGDVVGKWSVDRMTENGQCLVDVSTERGLLLPHTFQHELIHQYSIIVGKGDQRSLLDYAAVDI